MAAIDSLNGEQFARYGGGFFTKPAPDPNLATASKPRYQPLAAAATRASRDVDSKTLAGLSKVRQRVA
jgi:hypothetical protein